MKKLNIFKVLFITGLGIISSIILISISLMFIVGGTIVKKIDKNKLDKQSVENINYNNIIVYDTVRVKVYDTIDNVSKKYPTNKTIKKKNTNQIKEKINTEPLDVKNKNAIDQKNDSSN